MPKDFQETFNDAQKFLEYLLYQFKKEELEDFAFLELSERLEPSIPERLPCINIKFFKSFPDSSVHVLSENYKEPKKMNKETYEDISIRLKDFLRFYFSDDSFKEISNYSENVGSVHLFTRYDKPYITATISTDIREHYYYQRFFIDIQFFFDSPLTHKVLEDTYELYKKLKGDEGKEEFYESYEILVKENPCIH